MDIVILDSAYKHGITEESILYCLFHFNNDIMLNYPPMKRLNEINQAVLLFVRRGRI
jgi:hypothetical protein